MGGGRKGIFKTQIKVRKWKKSREKGRREKKNEEDEKEDEENEEDEEDEENEDEEDEEVEEEDEEDEEDEKDKEEGEGGGPVLVNIHVISLGSPGRLAKARRLQLADASFRDILSYYMFFFVLPTLSGTPPSFIFWFIFSEIILNVIIGVIDFEHHFFPQKKTIRAIQKEVILTNPRRRQTSLTDDRDVAESSLGTQTFQSPSSKQW